MCIGFPITLNWSEIWIASSLVGVRISAKIPYGSSANFCRIGRAKASVLPDPVCETPIQFFPSRILGIQCSWTGVGFVIPKN